MLKFLFLGVAGPAAFELLVSDNNNEGTREMAEELVNIMGANAKETGVVVGAQKWFNSGYHLRPTEMVMSPEEGRSDRALA